MRRTNPIEEPFEPRGYKSFFPCSCSPMDHRAYFNTLNKDSNTETLTKPKIKPGTTALLKQATKAFQDTGGKAKKDLTIETTPQETPNLVMMTPKEQYNAYKGILRRDLKISQPNLDPNQLLQIMIRDTDEEIVHMLADPKITIKQLRKRS